MSENFSHAKLRTPQAAEFAGLATSTLEKLRVSGQGPAYIKVGKAVIYDVADIEEWLATKRRRSTSVAA